MNDVNLRYLDLLLKHFEPHQYHFVTLSELEVVICTSRRNVSIVMKKLATYGWVDWKPAIGRSNASRLNITISLQQAMTEFLVEELGRGRMNSITKLIDWFGQSAVRALTIASEKVNQLNESNNAILISSYPWVSKVDPANTYRHTELHVAKSVYDVLLTQNSNGGIEPSLAHEWKMEGNVMMLWLRPGIYRHDGELLSIQDVSLVSTPSICTVSLGELFSKADARLRKIMVAGVVREFEDASRNSARNEVSGVGRVVLGGLVG